MLAHPIPSAIIALMTDASDIGLGASIQQWNKENWEPLAFFSRKLTDTEKKYSAYDRELLAIYAAGKYFRYFLEGTFFVILTDHKPLTYAFSQKLDKFTPRQARNLEFISQFCSDIRHISGKDNIVADTLSRVQTISTPSPIDISQMAQEQLVDETLKCLLQDKTGLTLKRIRLPPNEVDLYCDISTHRVRPYVPTTMQRSVFDCLHNLAHPGARATIKLISSRYVWKDMKKNILQMTRNCVACQKSKINRHTKSPLGKFEVPSERFQHINIDIIGPMPITATA